MFDGGLFVKLVFFLAKGILYTNWHNTGLHGVLKETRGVTIITRVTAR